MDIFEVPRRIFWEADKHGIKVLHNTPSLIGIMRRRLGDRIIGNKVTSKLNALLLRSGKVIFE
jgi:transcriptional regulator